MAIDRNPSAESEKPAAGSTSDTPITEGADASDSEVKTFLQKLGDASTPVVTGQVIQVADASGDLTGMLPAIEVDAVNVNLLETQPNVLGDHKTGPLDSLPAPLPKVEFVQTHLSPDAIALNAELVHKALTIRFRQSYTPNVEAVKNILQNMEEVDRQQLEQIYEQKYGTTLRQALRTCIRSRESLVTIEAILNSKNGEANLSGNAQIALTVAESDPVRGMRLLRAVLGTLNPVQATELGEKFKSDYGISFADAINANEGLNKEQKEVLTGLLGGITELSPDILMELARKATLAKDIGLLSTVLGGDLPNNIATRGLANADPDFKRLLLDNFGLTPFSLIGPSSKVENPIANDILREGRISLATILISDTSTVLHFLDNPQNTDWVFTHATPKDRRDYILGRTLTETGRQPANEAEAEAKRIYDILEGAIRSQAEGPRQAILREQLLFGGKFLTSDLAGMVAEKYFIGLLGGDYNVSDMLVHIEKNLTEKQFDLLRDPTYKDEFTRSLLSFLNPDEQAKILSLIEAKLTAQNFEASKAILRPLETFIADYKASGTVNIKQFIERLEAMSAAEATRYQTDPAFKKTIDDFGQLLIDTGDSQAENAIPLIKNYLNQVAQTGKPPAPTELDKLIREWGFVNDELWQGMDESAIQAKKFQTIAQVELILKDPLYMATLKSIFDRQMRKVEGPPLTREEEALLRSMNAILLLNGAGGNAFYALMAEENNTVGWAGRRPFDGVTVSDKALTYTFITKLPPDQLHNWRTSYLFDYQKAILENVLKQNGTLTTADKLRVLVTQGGKLTDMSEDFASLNEADFALIEKEYLEKYKTDLKTDLRNTLPQRESMTPEQVALFETILSQNGKVFPIDRIRMLVNGNGGKFSDYQKIFADLKPEDWTKLQDDYKLKYGVDLKEAILASVTKNENLDLNHQVLTRHILEEGNGVPQLVDRMRAFILGDGGKFRDFKQMLKSLSLEQRQKLHDDYLLAFKTNLNNDFLNKVDKAYKLEYSLLLSVTPRDALKDFFDRMNNYREVWTADGGGDAFDRFMQVDEQMMRRFNATFEKVPQVVQEAMAEYYSQYYDNASQSNEKFAEFMTNVIMTGASIAAFIAFMPAGIGVVLAKQITQELARKLVVMATLSATGAVSRPALLATFEGENFDTSPQSLLMNGGLGALEMLLSYPFGMGVLAGKSTIAITATQATERANGLMTKIAALSGNPNDPMLAGTRSEVRELITALASHPDKEQAGVLRDQLIAALIGKNDPIAKEVYESAAVLTAKTNEVFSNQVADVLTKVNAVAPDNPGALAATRSEAWNAISTKSGASPELIAKAQTDLLNALVAKEDPVAIAAQRALTSIDSLSNVSGAEIADKLKERVFQALLSTDAAAREAVVQVQQQADQALTNLLIRRIETQAETLASADLQTMKAQALSALNSLSALGSTPEIATLRNQLLQALAKAKDPAAQAALEISSLIERQANNSLDFATLASFNQKMQQEPALLDAALNLLQKQKADVDGLTAKLITDATNLPTNLTAQELSVRALNATDQLKALTEPSPEVIQALKKQATDAIEALATKGADKTQLELDFYQALSRHDSSVAATVANLEQTALYDATVKQIENILINVQAASGNPVELAALRGKALESLAKLGDTPEALAMRSRILTALDQSDDPLTKIAVQAFASIKGLNNEETLAQKIMLSLARGNENELQLIRLGALRNRLSTTAEGVEGLRQQALEVVKKLSDETRDFERLELLRQLKDKDPVSNSALQALESLDGLSTETRNRITQSILTALEQGNVDALKSAHISSLTEKILSDSGNNTNLMSQALSLISSLSSDAGSARLNFLKAIEQKVDAAKPAREALERIIGSENESDLTARIVSSLTSNNTDELARIQVNSIITNIERGVSDFDTIRKELLDAILTLPSKEQQALRMLGLKALRDKGDTVAKTALELNDAFIKASENALDLVTLAKLKQSLPQDIDAALAAFGRDRTHFNSLFSSTQVASLQKLGNLDAKALTEHLNSLTEQITASAADKEMVAALQKEMTNSLQTLATKISDLRYGSYELAAVRQRALSSLEQLKGVATDEEIEALRTGILRALAQQDDPIAKFTLKVNNYFDNAATLTSKEVAEIEKLDPSLRTEALSILGRTREELDQIRTDAIARFRSVDGNDSVEVLMNKINSAAEELARLADPSEALRDSLKQQVAASVDSIMSHIKTGSSLLPVDKRKEAFQILDNLSNKGFTDLEEAALRTKILEALALKEDPTAMAAIEAFDAIKGLNDEAVRSSNILSALSKDSSFELRNIQIAAIQDRILLNSGDLNILRNQALEAISHLPIDRQLAEKLKLLTAIADKDPIAKATLGVNSYFDNAANLSIDDIVAIQNLDPTLRTETLAILGRSDAQMDQIVTDSLARLGAVKPNLTLKESLDLIDNSLADIERIASVSGPVYDTLRRQISATVDNIANDIRSGTTTLIGDKRKEVFQLLDGLSEKGFTQAEETVLRNKILESLVAKDDPVANAAIAAFNAVKGLEDEAARTTNILSALSRDSQTDLRRIQIESLKEKILAAGSADVNALRKQALEAISHLPPEVQKAEKLKLLTEIVNKDPIAKTALDINNYFDDALNLSYDDIVAIEKLDPTLRTQALLVLSRPRQELEQIIADSLTRLGTVNSQLPFEETLNLLNKSISDLQRLADASGRIGDSLRRQIQGSIEKIADDIKNGSATITGDKRKDFFQLLENLSQRGFTETEETTLRLKTLQALADKKDPTAMAAIAAFEVTHGLNQQQIAERTTQILAALAKDSQVELRQIQISLIEEKILKGTGDINLLRKQALEAISSLPDNEMQQIEQLRLLTSISQKDPIAQTALSIKAYFENSANLSLNDLSAIEKLDPIYRNEALTILEKSKQQIDQLVNDSITRLSSVKPDLAARNYIDGIKSTLSELKSAIELSEPLREALKKRIEASIEAISRNIGNSTFSLTSENKKEIFTLLEQLTKEGFTDSQVGTLRKNLLSALVLRDDATAKAAVAAFDAVHGLDDQTDLATKIWSALSRDSHVEISQIQIASIERKILSGTGDINKLRTEALKAIAELPFDKLQIEAEVFRFLTAIADGDAVAKTALSVKSYLDNAANLSIDDLTALEKLNPSINSEALSIIGRTKQELDQIIASSHSRLAVIKPDASLDDAISAINTAIGDLKRLTDASPALRDTLKQRISSSLDAIEKNIQSSSAKILPEKRAEALALLDDLGEHGFSYDEVVSFRNKILDALAAKEDPVAQAAISAIEAMRGLPDETARYSNIVEALARNSSDQIRRIEISYIQEKILAGIGDVNLLREQALKAISQITKDLREKALDDLLFKIKDVDPVASAALKIKSYFSNAANLSADDIVAIEKLDPSLRGKTLRILEHTTQELEQIRLDSLARIRLVKSELPFDQAVDSISATADQLKRFAEVSTPLRDSFKQNIQATIDSIADNITAGSTILSGDNRKQIFQLLDRLSDEGFGKVEVAALRSKVLKALASKEDPTATAALAAFDALKGLDEQQAFNRTKDILTALAQDNQVDLARAHVAIIQDKILAGLGDTNILRNDALSIISQMPQELRLDEKLRLFSDIQEKDPFAKMALRVNAFFENEASRNLDFVAELEKLDPEIRKDVLSVLDRTEKDLDQAVSNALSRLTAVEPNLPLDDAVNTITLSLEDMDSIAAASPALQNAFRKRITASVDAIANDIQSGAQLLGAQRVRAFELIESLSKHGFPEAQANDLRDKILKALVAKKDSTAMLAVTALDAAKGLGDETALNAKIFSALTRNRPNEIRAIEISSIEAKIIAGAEDVVALRTQALQAISQLPDKAQLKARIDFLTAIVDKDSFARAAISINDILTKNVDASFDLIALAKMRTQLKDQNIYDILVLLERPKSELDAVTSKLAAEYSESLRALDATGLSNRLTTITEQLALSVKDKELVSVLRKQVTETIDALTKKILELPTTYTEAAILKEQVNAAMQTLKSNISRLEYTRLENVLRQSFARFEKSAATHASEVATTTALDKMNAALEQIKALKGTDFVRVREQGLIALKEMEGVVDAQTFARARKDFLEALAAKNDRFAINVLKRDALRESAANGDFTVLSTLEREIKKSLDSGVTNQETINFLKGESDALALMQNKVIRMRTANTALERLTANSDQTLIAAARKEASEALALMKPHLNESAMTRLQAQLDQTLARFEKPAVATVASAADIKVAEVKAAEVINTATPQRLTELSTSIKNFKGSSKELATLRTEALKVLDDAELIVDAATLARMRKEIYEALAAQKDDFAVKALRRMALKEEAEKGKLNPLARMEQDLTKEIERVQARVATLERRAGVELELAAERRVLQTLQKEQAAAAALRKVLEIKVIPVAVAATVARATAREIYAPNPEEPIKEVPSNLVPSAALMELARVRLGEGPWQSAERILASDGKEHTVAEVRALTRAIQATYLMDNGSSDMSGLPVNYFFVTPDNYGALINAVKDDNIKLILLGLAN